MKELPYFRFTVSEWLNDDISLETYEVKGLFIDICSYYWFKDCNVTKQMLSKRFANAEQMLNGLYESEIIKVDDENNVRILFLDVQYEKASQLSSVRSKCAKMKGLQKKQKLSKSKAIAKQKHIYKDKDKDKEKDNDKELFPGPVSPLFKKTWNNFVDFRKGKKAPLTKQAKILIIDKFKGLGESVAIAMLNKSIMNGWTGVFDLDDKELQKFKRPRRQGEKVFIVGTGEV